MPSLLDSPLVSIVILNWNGRDFLKDCVKSVAETNYPKELIETIVVDNGSTDGSADEVKQMYPQTKLIKNRSNLGFCAGNNIGVKHSRGSLIIFLNNDTIVDKNWIKDLLIRAKGPDVGVIGCRIYYPGTNVIQSIGFCMKWVGFWETMGSGYEDTGQFNHIEQVDFVSGAALAIKREVVDKIGLFDPDFFAYCEDLDLCYRVKKAGYKIVTCQAKVFHFGSKSFESFPIKKVYLTNRNTTWFILKNYDASKVLRYFIEYPIRISKEDTCKFLMKNSVLQRLSFAEPVQSRSRALHFEALKTEVFTLSLFFASIFPVLRSFSSNRQKRQPT
jgi:GT2 family glycosyltransferase